MSTGYNLHLIDDSCPVSLLGEINHNISAIRVDGGYGADAVVGDRTPLVGRGQNGWFHSNFVSHFDIVGASCKWKCFTK